jgi:transcriptional regulator with XRE-family HTH domain
MTDKLRDFGILIRDARVKLRISQRELATYVDKKATTVSRWEKGERRPKQASLLALSNVLGIKIQTLQSTAGYTPEFDWYVSVSAQPGSPEDVLINATEEERESLRQYLHFLRFRERIRGGHVGTYVQPDKSK